MTAAQARGRWSRHDRLHRSAPGSRGPNGCGRTLVALGQILAVTIVLILCVAYLTLAERKVIG